MTAEILSAHEVARLVRCESEIERGLETFVEVGRALLTIRDERLYRAEFPTFEVYCEQRWQITPQHAGRLMIASRVADELEPMGSTPATERVARELAPLRTEPEKLREVWTEAVERSNGKPTAAVVREVREEFTEANRTMSDALDERVPNWRGDVERTRVRSRWSRAMAAAADVPLLDPEALVAVLSESEIAATRITVRECARWLDRLDTARRPGLRVVTGGGPE